MKRAHSVKNEKGMATLEMLPLLFVFIYLFSYMLGAFGIIHTGIKNSIAARAYAFETFRNRSTLVYFRDLAGADFVQFRTHGNRFHGILGEGSDSSGKQFVATERAIRMGIPIDSGPSRNDSSIHNEKVHVAGELSNGKRNQQVEVSPAWIMIQYGICIDVSCGDKK